MIREAVEALGEANAREIMDYIKREYPKLDFKESSFRADIIGCSVNHSSSHWYPGMPKFLYFNSLRKTYKINNNSLFENEKKPAITNKSTDHTLKSLPKPTKDQIEIGKRILQSFKDNSSIFKDYTSISIDEDIDPDIYLNYITLTSAIDYQKMIQANDLWKNSKKWAKEYPWLFKPDEFSKRTVEEIFAVFKEIRRSYGLFFEIKDIGIWIYISAALKSYGGSTLNLLQAFEFNAWNIYQELSTNRKKEFPYLSGDKILPMWLKILFEDGEVALKNMDKLPLPVDKNVAEVTYNLILQKVFDGNVTNAQKEEVRAVWNAIAKELNVPVITFDTALWVLGGKSGCSDSQRKNCPICIVGEYCYRTKYNKISKS